jgi:hypothetical protein
MAMSVSVFCKSEACTIFTMPQLNELQKSIIRTLIKTRCFWQNEKLRKLELLEENDNVRILLILRDDLKMS